MTALLVALLLVAVLFGLGLAVKALFWVAIVAAPSAFDVRRPGGRPPAVTVMIHLQGLLTVAVLALIAVVLLDVVF